MTYDEFLNSKVCVAEDSGFDVDNNEINPNLKPHQREAVKWACKGGRRALFESFGLGKTVQELEFCRLVLKHEGGRALLVLPLGVRQEFTHDAVNLLGIKPPKYVRTMKEIENCTDEICMTNYERVRDGDIEVCKKYNQYNVQQKPQGIDRLTGFAPVTGIQTLEDLCITGSLM